MSKPNPNDLAINLLHYRLILITLTETRSTRDTVFALFKNEVSGGFSTLVDGFSVAEYIKLNEPEAFESLTKTNLRYRFQDKDIILENWES